MTSESKKNILLKLKQAKASSECSVLLKQFYNETSYLVHAFCKKKGLSPEDTEEVVQIVYIKIFTKRNQYNPDHSPLAWLYIITRSETKDFLKSQRIYKNYVSEFYDFLSQTDSLNPSNIQGTQTLPTDDIRSLLSENSSVLSEKEMTALKSRYSDEKDFGTIAAELNTSSLNIRKIISRGLKKIKERSSSNV